VEAVPDNRLSEYRVRLRLSQSEAAEQLSALADEPLGIDGNAVSRHERGKVAPSEKYRRLYARLYGADQDELWPVAADETDAFEALELARRAEASDLGNHMLDQLDVAFDDFACSYASTPPAELLSDVRTLLRYVSQLMDARATLVQKRRLLVVGGWLSLLAATLYVDLAKKRSARAMRDTAFSLGGHAEQPELQAWAYEIDGWSALVDRNYVGALAATEAGAALAPHGSSVAAQIAAQEARAAARVQDANRTLAALRRANAALVGLSVPERPEHHFTYDGRKLEWYTGTVLAWLGDERTAEGIARQVIRQYENDHRSPRRLITARIDLGLVLAGTEPDEAAQLGSAAISSGWLVPSNSWRAGELQSVLSRRYPDLPEARELREQWKDFTAR
jgi:transcriptional regulator with XRE-family HTH domain